MITKEDVEKTFEWVKQKINFSNCKIVWISEQKIKHLEKNMECENIFNELGIYGRRIKQGNLFSSYYSDNSILICYEKLYEKLNSLPCSNEEIFMFLKYIFLYGISHLKFCLCINFPRVDVFAYEYSSSFFSDKENKKIFEICNEINKKITNGESKILKGYEEKFLLHRNIKIDPDLLKP
jgi:hypothetical protein